MYASGDEIVFEREQVWGLGAIPSRHGKKTKTLSYHIQAKDTAALCILMDVESVKLTHGYRYANLKHLMSMGIRQDQVDKLIGWASRLRTGSRVYDHDGPPRKLHY